MAEMLAERLAGWHGWVVGGVLAPFVVAAAMKTLQGSSLVAAITAAGIVHPLVDVNAKALAALAVGAGAMTVSHVNDEYFWVVTQSAGLRRRGSPAHLFPTGRAVYLKRTMPSGSGNAAALSRGPALPSRTAFSRAPPRRHWLIGRLDLPSRVNYARFTRRKI